MDALLEASARILESDDSDEAFTIQAVCELAGASPGSFYQYFPHKEALMYGLLRAHATDVTERMLEVLADAATTATPDLLSRAVDAFVAAHVERTTLHARLGRFVASRAGPGLEEDLMGMVEQTVATVMRSRPDELAGRDAEVLAFLFVRTLEGTVHAAARDQPELLSKASFRASLKAMLAGLVA